MDRGAVRRGRPARGRRLRRSGRPAPGADLLARRGGQARADRDLPQGGRVAPGASFDCRRTRKRRVGRRDPGTRRAGAAGGDPRAVAQPAPPGPARRPMVGVRVPARLAARRRGARPGRRSPRVRLGGSGNPLAVRGEARLQRRRPVVAGLQRGGRPGRAGPRGRRALRRRPGDHVASDRPGSARGEAARADRVVGRGGRRHRARGLGLVAARGRRGGTPLASPGARGLDRHRGRVPVPRPDHRAGRDRRLAAARPAGCARADRDRLPRRRQVGRARPDRDHRRSRGAGRTARRRPERIGAGRHGRLRGARQGQERAGRGGRGRPGRVGAHPAHGRRAGPGAARPAGPRARPAPLQPGLRCAGRGGQPAPGPARGLLAPAADRPAVLPLRRPGDRRQPARRRPRRSAQGVRPGRPPDRSRSTPRAATGSAAGARPSPRSSTGFAAPGPTRGCWS